MKPTFLTLLIGFALALQIGCTTEEKKKFISQTKGAIVTKEVPYRVGGQVMNGFFALPEGKGPFPGVLVVHEWWGQTDYPRNRARQLARSGYAAFVVDMYGKGQVVKHPKDAQAFASQVMSNMDAAEKNFRAAMKTLHKQFAVDPTNTAAIGYCFGGGVVLEMARRGVPLNMVASYHGNISPLVKNSISPMKTRMIIFNGADDPFVKKENLNLVRSKLKQAKVRYKFINYKGAKHAFTNPAATANGEKFNLPLEYNKRADEQSWNETLKAFDIVFKKQK